MSQGVLCPNLTKKFQSNGPKWPSQIAMRCGNRWFKCKLKPPKKKAEATAQDQVCSRHWDVQPKDTG